MMRSLYVIDEVMSWDGYDDLPIVALSVEFCMLGIDRYTGIGCLRIHLQLYSVVMRVRRGRRDTDDHVASSVLEWCRSVLFASLDPSQRRTWTDLE